MNQSARSTFRRVIVALGANQPSPLGPPPQTFAWAIGRLVSETPGADLVGVSAVYRTAPLAGAAQPSYHNAIVVLQVSETSASFLRGLKRLERLAGRRPRGRHASRPLDLDLIAHGGRHIGGGARAQQSGRLVLPHPEMEKRSFVLVPLLNVAPRWRSPRRGVSAVLLLHSLPREPSRPVRVLEPDAFMWHIQNMMRRAVT